MTTEPPGETVIGAWIHALCGNPAAVRWLEAAERRAAVGDEPVVALVRAATCPHGPRRMHADVEAALAALPAESAWLPRAHAMGERVYEFTEYLVDRLGVTDLGARWDGVLTYHPSCHTLRGMRIDRQPRLLLANVKGATIVELPDAEECCGFGGIFSVEHPELSGEWLKRKISNLETVQSPTLVVTECGCLMHIAGGLHRQKKTQRVVHIAEVLDHH